MLASLPLFWMIVFFSLIMKVIVLLVARAVLGHKFHSSCDNVHDWGSLNDLQKHLHVLRYSINDYVCSTKNAIRLRAKHVRTINHLHLNANQLRIVNLKAAYGCRFPTLMHGIN